MKALRWFPMCSFSRFLKSFTDLMKVISKGWITTFKLVFIRIHSSSSAKLAWKRIEFFSVNEINFRKILFILKIHVCSSRFGWVNAIEFWWLFIGLKYQLSLNFSLVYQLRQRFFSGIQQFVENLKFVLCIWWLNFSFLVTFKHLKIF